MAAPAQSCDDHCASLNLQCVDTGAFPNGTAVDIFKEVGIDCKKTDSYVFKDQPCYAFQTGMCYGAKNIPSTIDCQVGQNLNVKRLCPCH